MGKLQITLKVQRYLDFTLKFQNIDFIPEVL